MLKNRYVIGGGILFVLIVANIINYILSGWGLITVRVTDAPLGQVIKSIERQGWVTIYTDIDPTTTVSMDVIKVPLPEAMATLCANIGGGGGGRPPGGGTRDGGARPDGGNAGGPPGGGAGRPPGGGGGGFGGGAQWKLGFFAAATSAQVKDEIRNFQAGNTGDETRIFSYPTPLDMLSGDSDGMAAADPRLQNWPGYKTPPAPAVAAAAPDGQAPAAPADPPAAPSTVQDYLNALAQESDIWVMAPSGWETPVSGAPSPTSSIIRAVKNLVGSAHGSVQEAIVVTSRRRSNGGGNRGGGFGGGDTGWSYTQDRIRNAINGLPEDSRAGALTQLDAEVKFMHDVQAAPQDQQRAMMRSHFMNRTGRNDFRRSPEKRAQMYARAVANRQTARGQ